MENFVLYDELGKGDHYKVYKGRRRNTVNFLSIHCADKCKRAEITNMVRLIHEIDHRNVLKFYEWYETTNHLWLVVELCNGGSLQTIISQDEHLPEAVIRKFGVDLVEGLHHVHSLGIIFCDIKPSKVYSTLLYNPLNPNYAIERRTHSVNLLIMLDGCGNFKFADFGLSRVDGENLDDLFDTYVGEQCDEPPVSDRGDHAEKSDDARKLKTLGTPRYLAPELINGEQHSVRTDFWSLGCVFYEMFTGYPPFEADTLSQLKNMILHEKIPPPSFKGSTGVLKPSAEFSSLVSGLMERNPDKRLDWGALVMHPFWEGSLLHLAKELEGFASVRASVHQSINQFSGRASVVHELPSTDEINSKNSPADPALNDESSAAKLTENTDAVEIMFTLSARACSRVSDTDQSVSSRTSRVRTPHAVRAEDESCRESIGALIYHSTDFTVTSISAANKKNQAVKYDSKIVPLQTYTADKLAAMALQEQEKHYKSIVDACDDVEKGSTTRGLIHLLNYVCTVSINPSIANDLVRNNILTSLTKHCHDTQNLEMKLRLGKTIGVIASSVNELDPATNLQEVMTKMTSLLKDNFRNNKLKQTLLSALGELMVMISKQESMNGNPQENWSVPSVAYNLIVRCLRESEDTTINHCAARIIENIGSRSCQHALKFATNEVAQQLWYVFTHAAVDSLRITALSGLARLTWHVVGVFQSVLDKVGLPKLLEAMSLPIVRVQQAMMTMFASLIHSDVKFTSIAKEKEFVQSIMRALDSPSAVIRAKAFLVLIQIIRNSSEMLLLACELRLMMYIERDSRAQSSHESEAEYLTNCLNCLIDTLLHTVPYVNKQILSSLEAVDGKKHPSTVQIKQLKSSLQLLPIILHAVNCKMFRSRLVSDQLMSDVAELLRHIHSIDSGSTQINSALGTAVLEELFSRVFSILESLIESNALLILKYNDVFIERILPSLAALICSGVGDTRGLSLRLFTEISCVLFDSNESVGSDVVFDRQNTIKKLHKIVTSSLLPQFEQVLVDSDPIPSYGLKLLHTLIKNDGTLLRDLDKFNIFGVLFEVIADHQSNVACNTLQLIVFIFNLVISRKETNIKRLLEQGFDDHFIFLFTGITAICLNMENFTGDMNTVRLMLHALLEMLHNMLKYMSEVVRKALDNLEFDVIQLKHSAKKQQSESLIMETEMAESLLLTGKPFIDFVSPLTGLLVYDDAEVMDVSLKCFLMLVQFYGGEHSNSFSNQNIAYFNEALRKSDAKRQKIILKIIKRMLSTDKEHIVVLQKNGSNFVETLQYVAETASSTAEVTLNQLAVEVMKMIGAKS